MYSAGRAQMVWTNDNTLTAFLCQAVAIEKVDQDYEWLQHRDCNSSWVDADDMHQQMKALSLSLLLCSSTHHNKQRSRPVSGVSILAGTSLTAYLCMLHTGHATVDTDSINRWMHSCLACGLPITAATALIEEACLCMISIIVAAIKEVEYSSFMCHKLVEWLCCWLALANWITFPMIQETFVY